MDIHEELRVREFELLRAEILSHQHLENNWALFAATGTGAALAFAIERGDALLCLTAPFIVLASSFRVAAIRYYVWRISAYLMVHFDERDAPRGSAWELSLLRLRVLRRAAGRSSPSSDSWLLLFGLLLLGGCLASLLVWLRGMLDVSQAEGRVEPLNADLAWAVVTLAACGGVWVACVRRKFAKGLGKKQQNECVEDWKRLLASEPASK